ncbi:hypothetical protein [Acidovorax sp. SRB_24]|uniref:hypothetical protein n=1 Tax=Acidovorax sp. SRB_24 TaxID=1962700 RepID=UPI00145EA6C4|nr:hypothetical protein [Acidovorax sp. SRB_24]NMM76215.1 hypothetical protein [Acidovorax sp. SRB_24]
MNTNTTLDSIFPIVSYDLLNDINQYPDDKRAAKLSHEELECHLATILGTSRVLYVERDTDPLTGEETRYYVLPKEIAIFVASAFSTYTAYDLSRFD